MSDQLGPWMIDPENKDTRYLVVDNLYNEMRVIGGVKEVVVEADKYDALAEYLNCIVTVQSITGEHIRSALGVER